MKADERHGLKTNELALWLSNLPQWTKDNLQNIIYVTAAVVLVAAGIYYYFYQKDVTTEKNQADLSRLLNSLTQSKAQIVQAQSQGMDVSYNLIQTADELDDLAGKVKDSDTSALALVKRGDALRMELHYRPETPSKDAVAEQLNKAKSSYEQALAKASDSPSLAAKAKLGIGLSEEGLGNFEAASKIYHEIAADAALAGTVAAAGAKERIAYMNEFQKQVTFKPAPKAPPQALVPEVNAPSINPMPEIQPQEVNQGQK